MDVCTQLPVPAAALMSVVAAVCELCRRLIKSPKVADVDTLLVKTSWLFSINYADNTDAPTSAARLVAAARSGLCNFEGRS